MQVFLDFFSQSVSSACDTDTYFENIQTVLIFLKYYCCVTHLKYYKIVYFFMKKYFLFHVSIKPVWNNHEKKVFPLWNLSNFIVLTSKLLLQKKLRTSFCEKIVRRKELWWWKLSSGFDESESDFSKWNYVIARFYQQHFWITWTKERRKRKVTI